LANPNGTGSAWRDAELVGWIKEAVARGEFAADESHGRYPLAEAIDVPSLVAQQLTSRDWLSLVRGGSVLDPAIWSVPEGSPDVARVEEAYRSGYSLVMRRMHIRVPVIAELARQLDRALVADGQILRRAVRSNLFSSPAGAEGLALHHDDHDVAVLQLAGEKQWSVFTPAYRWPLGNPDRHLRPDDCDELVYEGVLRPGSLLFMPKGYPHQAHTVASPSVHITLGVELCTWLDLVTAVAPYAEPLRRSLPRLDTASPLPAGRWSELVREVVASVSDERSARRGLADLAERAMRTAAPPPRGRDWDAAPERATASTLVRRKASALSMLVDLGGGAAALCMHAARLGGGPELRALVAFLHERAEFQVSELPGDLDDDAKVGLANQLLAAGFLQLVDGAPDGERVTRPEEPARLPG
jgi:JmjC domain